MVSARRLNSSRGSTRQSGQQDGDCSRQGWDCSAQCLNFPHGPTQQSGYQDRRLRKMTTTSIWSGKIGMLTRRSIVEPRLVRGVFNPGLCEMFEKISLTYTGFDQRYRAVW